MSDENKFSDEDAKVIEQQLAQASASDLDMVAAKLKAELGKRNKAPNFAKMSAAEANAMAIKDWNFPLGWKD